MCEPYHSIVQFPEDYPDDDLPFSSQLDPSTRIQTALQQIKDTAWLKKIKRFFHLSKMGSGHSGATGFGRKHLIYLPPSQDFEGVWWDRRLRRDGPSLFRHNNSYDNRREESFSVAEEYFQRVAVGDIKIFRRFLEASLTATSRPQLYEMVFCDGCLMAKGRDQLWAKLKNTRSKQNRIKIVMGFTRQSKRKLLQPQFADDQDFWTPNKKKKGKRDYEMVV